MEFLLFVIAFGASVIGAICGIGGGVIIKPLLDLFGIAGVAEISFLSGCTVLAMSCYSVLRTLTAGDSLVRFKTGTPLAVGAAFGGILGKSIFSFLLERAADPQRVGGYQALCLAAVTIGTLIYTLNKKRIRTRQEENLLLCVVVGLLLGIMSSFLGIGGGPINLVVLYYFFSMETKEAAQNSLYMILISQVTSLGTTVVTGGIPEFHGIWLAIMVVGGIAGGAAGRGFNKKLQTATVDRLFAGLMLVIIGMNLYLCTKMLL